MTFKVVCESDVSVDSVRHFLCSIVVGAAVVRRRSRLGEHNDGDLGRKMVDVWRMTSLQRGTHHSATNRLELLDCGSEPFPRLQRLQQIAVYLS